MPEPGNNEESTSGPDKKEDNVLGLGDEEEDALVWDSKEDDKLRLGDKEDDVSESGD